MKLLGPPRRPEFDQYTIRFTIGAIALSLPLIEIFLTKRIINSISESYWYTCSPWPRNIFVGFLFAVSTLMIAYNGKDELEMWLGKLTSLCGFGIALFPCDCLYKDCKVHVCIDQSPRTTPDIHFPLTVVMFAILGVFCVIFWRHARLKEHKEARRRMAIYSVCCLGFVASLVFFMIWKIKGIDVLDLWGETFGLGSFGVSWLTASRVAPFLTNPAERKHLFVRT